MELTPPPNTNKQDYSGGTNDKTRDSQTRESEDYRSDTYGCARNMMKNIKLKKMKITLTLHLKIYISFN